MAIVLWGHDIHTRLCWLWNTLTKMYYRSDLLVVLLGSSHSCTALDMDRYISYALKKDQLLIFNLKTWVDAVHQVYRQRNGHFLWLSPVLANPCTTKYYCPSCLMIKLGKAWQCDNCNFSALLSNGWSSYKSEVYFREICHNVIWEGLVGHRSWSTYCNLLF